MVGASAGTAARADSIPVKQAVPPGQPGQPDAVVQTRSSTPQDGVSAGAAKPNPVISRVSQRKACSWRRFATPPWAR